jgi:hypothetical protein
MRTLLVTLAFVLTASSLPAQQPSAPDSAQRGAQEAAAMMGPMMQQMAPMMGQMAAMTLEGTLTALAKPENAERLADFTKHYYDALIKRGFTKDQALQIVVAVGVPRPTPPSR